MNWFDVDKQGLGKLLERRGKVWALFELLANTFDTNAKKVTVNVTAIPGAPKAQVEVIDDDPEGFSNLAHAYTLFAESIRKGDATKRGRFNLGEKITLALCDEATIESTKGTIVFNASGRSTKRTKRDVGSRFSGIMRITREELEEALVQCKAAIPPPDVQVTVNGEVLPARDPIATVEATLQTEVADEEGVLRRTSRKTTVRVYEPLRGEIPSVYELGIPVVETDDRWHVDVCQKVPLNFDRDNVPPAYLRDLRVLVLNALHDRLSEKDANATWVRDAGSDPEASNEAMGKIMDLRFGENRVAYDPTDLEANKLAVSKGYTLVYGSMLNGQEWQNAKRAESILPAGKVMPSRPEKVEHATMVPEEKWTKGMHRVAEYAKMLARELMGVTLKVKVHNDPQTGQVACYGDRTLLLNLGRLGYAWFDGHPSVKVDELLIHEFGHQFCGDHLDEAYHDALCNLGAKMARLALDKPHLFK